ncbi:MAG: T9SS type A sorting domain-containing protein, partial [Bacteroidia bacterium]|nr:T9SS type A sorting domain-containing protein [Bacteroidia bacterium]
FLPLEISGEGPWRLRYRENGIERGLDVGVGDSGWVVYPEVNSRYELVGLEDKYGCEGYVEGSVEVRVEEGPFVRFGVERLEVCAGGRVEIPLELGGVGPWEVLYRVNGVDGGVWRVGGSGSGAVVVGSVWEEVLGNREYELVGVRDGRGCSRSVSGLLRVEVRGGLGVRVVSQREAGCAGGSISVVGEGGSGSYVYKLGGIENRSGKFEGLSGGRYELEVRDGFCVVRRLVEVAVGRSVSLSRLEVESSNSVRAVWPLVVGARSYNIRYREVGSGSWIVVEGLVGGEARLNELSGGKTYEFELQVVCESGVLLEWSSGLGVTTPGVSCEGVGRVFVEGVGSNSAMVRWEGVVGAVCYEVSYGPMNVDVELWDRFSLVPSSGRSVVLSGLVSGVEYGVRVRANCSLCSRVVGNRSVWSRVERFVTLGLRGFVGGIVDAGVRVYPNPSRGLVEVVGGEHWGELKGVVVRSLAGRELMRVEGGVDGRIDLSGLRGGVYLLELTYEGGFGVVRVVIE